MLLLFGKNSFTSEARRVCRSPTRPAARERAMEEGSPRYTSNEAARVPSVSDISAQL